MSKIKQTFIFDFDDFSSTRPGMEYLKKMKEHYPNFKCTLFTVPFSSMYVTNGVDVDKLYEWAEIVKEESDWLEIAVHGFVHTKGECLLPKDKARTLIKASENLFKKIKLPFVKIFKAPYWQMSKEFEEVLLEEGYVKAIDRNNPLVYTPIKTYTWTWSMEEPIPTYHTVKAHGHVWETPNGINNVLPNLLKIPTDVDFKFISEYLEENGVIVERVQA